MLRCFYFTNVSGAADEIKGIINLLSLVHRGDVLLVKILKSSRFAFVCQSHFSWRRVTYFFQNPKDSLTF